MLRRGGDISTCTVVHTMSRNSAEVSPPAFDAEQRYVPPSSGVTASIAKTGPSWRVRGPGSTSVGSAPVWEYHLNL